MVQHQNIQVISQQAPQQLHPQNSHSQMILQQHMPSQISSTVGPIQQQNPHMINQQQQPMTQQQTIVGQHGISNQDAMKESIQQHPGND